VISPVSCSGSPGRGNRRDGEDQGGEGGEQGGALVLKHQFQRAAVAGHHAIDEIVEELREPVFAAARLVAQHARAHHRRQRQRHDGRNDDGDGERQCELAEHAADKAGHEQQRNEHGDQRQRQRDHGEADFLGAAQRRLQRRFALLDVTDDVLEHHDGVVDHEAGADGQRHQRQIVERKPAAHDRECGDDRERQADAGDTVAASCAGTSARYTTSAEAMTASAAPKIEDGSLRCGR
jgi:hypothetical protein